MRIYGFERYGDADVEGHLEVPGPTPSAGTVLVEVDVVALNPGDVKVRAGARQGAFPVTFPMAMGREAAGRVLDDPSGTFAPGTPVFGSCAAGVGALGEQTLLDLDQTAAVPDGVPPEQAACLPVAAGTAWDALHELAVAPGQTVLVLGAGGGVGLPAVQLARHLGARVVGVASPAKASHVEAAGAVHVPSGAGWADRVREAVGQVDAVVDTVGAPVLADAAALLADRDRARLRSAAAPSLAAELGGGGITRRRERAVYAELAHLVAQGHLRPVVGARHGFDDAAAAVSAVAGGHALGKVVVTLPRV